MVEILIATGTVSSNMVAKGMNPAYFAWGRPPLAPIRVWGGWVRRLGAYKSVSIQYEFGPCVIRGGLGYRAPYQQICQFPGCKSREVQAITAKMYRPSQPRCAGHHGRDVQSIMAGIRMLRPRISELRNRCACLKLWLGTPPNIPGRVCVLLMCIPTASPR